MVERSAKLDSVFGALSDEVRRDILRRVAHDELSMNEIAEPYAITLAGVSKHVKVLEAAGLIRKRRDGKRQLVTLSPEGFIEAGAYIALHNTQTAARLDSLGRYLAKEQDQ